ncbi:hypothetical protein GCM10022419_067340 [Nonomuraea rosea]|uniref:Uncharacterized protein n=1 Tax=Nonomuraea rosea TaxID=638574 RepID=A0ABP6Y689_9ACTN
MAGKHEGEKPSSKPFELPKQDKNTNDGDGGKGSRGGDGKKK